MPLLAAPLPPAAACGAAGKPSNIEPAKLPEPTAAAAAEAELCCRAMAAGPVAASAASAAPAMPATTSFPIVVPKQAPALYAPMGTPAALGPPASKYATAPQVPDPAIGCACMAPNSSFGTTALASAGATSLPGEPEVFALARDVGKGVGACGPSHACGP